MAFRPAAEMAPCRSLLELFLLLLTGSQTARALDALELRDAQSMPGEYSADIDAASDGPIFEAIHTRRRRLAYTDPDFDNRTVVDVDYALFDPIGDQSRRSGIY